MTMVKQTIELAFGKGLDTKTDPFRVPMGNFLSLENMVFTIADRLTKRNGYGNLTALPESATFLTTFNENLTAIGTSLQAYSAGTNTWVNKGTVQPLMLSTLPLIRSNTNQSQLDTTISSNNLVCTVYTDQTPTSLATLRYMYAIADATTGQNIVAPTAIPANGGGTITGSPRVFLLGGHFIIAFTNVIGGVSHLQYIAVSTIDPTSVTANVDIASAYDSSPRLSWDGVVVNNNLYFAYDTSSGGQSIKITYITTSLGSPVSPVTYSNAGKVTATIMSMTADLSNPVNPVIWAAYNNGVTPGANVGYAVAVDSNLNKIITVPAQIITTGTIDNLSTIASGGVLTVFYEVGNNYGYDATIPTHYISKITVTQAGVVGSPSIVVRSVGLASKAFIVGDDFYFLAAWQSTFQPSYFLINSEGQVISRIAYGNGGGYLALGLPSISLKDNIASIGYLIKDFVTSQNTSTTEAITKSNIYSQTGCNLVNFTIGTSNVVPSEIAQALHLSGGFLWEYDGYSPVEHSFFLWPENVEGTPTNSGGAMVSQEYQYQVIYTWADNQGNIHNSAPSIPLVIDMSASNLAFVQPTPISFTAAFTANTNTMVVSSTTGLIVGQIVTDFNTPANIQAGSFITKIVGTTVTISLPFVATAVTDTIHTASINSVVLNIPTLRLTYKLSNPVKITIFRWSVAQQEFFQVTSIQTPLINSTSVDYVTYTDTAADNQILGNSLIYTTGGVVENIGSPSYKAITLFDDRLFGIESEDRNLFQYSKQVIEVTPVEMSDLFSIYVAPSTGSEGSTGPMNFSKPMDDKLVIFKDNAMDFINGTGPDNLGANSQYSQPLFITSTVGSSNQQSTVMIDKGLMFQSNKGIWLLGRDMGVSYIGAPVEQFTNTGNVQSAINVPGTTQVRFTLDTGITLMYDYFYMQWGVFSGVPAISSTLYKEAHTYLDKYGRVFQETPGQYLDGNNPVLMSFQSSWINIAGVNGYQRVHELVILGKFISPANIVIGIATDFGSPVQQSIITPFNFSGVYGADSLYGQSGYYGGPGPILEWRVQIDNQKCQAFQISMQEQFDASFGTVAGAGFTLTGITCVISMKKAYRPIPAINSVG